MKKKVTLNLKAQMPDFELLFNDDTRLNATGRKLLEDKPVFVRSKFEIAYQLGYSYGILKRILKCRSERECDILLATGRNNRKGQSYG